MAKLPLLLCPSATTSYCLFVRVRPVRHTGQRAEGHNWPSASGRSATGRSYRRSGGGYPSSKPRGARRLRGRDLNRWRCSTQHGARRRRRRQRWGRSARVTQWAMQYFDPRTAASSVCVLYPLHFRAVGTALRSQQQGLDRLDPLDTDKTSVRMAANTHTHANTPTRKVAFILICRSAFLRAQNSSPCLCWPSSPSLPLPADLIYRASP